MRAPDLDPLALARLLALPPELAGAAFVPKPRMRWVAPRRGVPRLELVKPEAPLDPRRR